MKNILLIFLILFCSTFAFGRSNYISYDNFTYVKIYSEHYAIGDMLISDKSYFINPKVENYFDLNGDNITDYLATAEYSQNGVRHLLYISECSDIYMEYDIGVSEVSSINKNTENIEICLAPSIEAYQFLETPGCLCYKYLDEELKSRYLMIDKNIFENELEFACPTGD